VSKNLVLIGAAPCSIDYSPLINHADLVVRFNECKQFGGNVGTRTDILCISNMGSPARRYIAQRPMRGLEPLRTAKIWFPRNTDVCLDHVSRMMEEDPGLRSAWRDLDFRDYSAEITEANDLGHGGIERFSKELNARVFRSLERPGDLPFFAPSTGILAVARVLGDPAFADHRVHLVGFGFAGWTGHPWRAERAFVANSVWRGRVAYYPV
jgi:hypothetical protein